MISDYSTLWDDLRDFDDWIEQKLCQMEKMSFGKGQKWTVEPLFEELAIWQT